MRHSKILALSALTVAILLFLLALFLVTTTQERREFNQHQQAQKQVTILLGDAAKRVSGWIKKRREDELALLANELSQAPLVVDVTVYDARGVVLAKSSDAMALNELLPIGSGQKYLPSSAEGKAVFVHELINDGETMGYLRLTLAEHVLKRASELATQGSYRSAYLLSLLLAVVAAVFAYWGLKRVLLW